VLDRYRIDTVLWEQDLALTQILRLSPQWREVFRDRDWIIFRRTS
jgi:hypothetical protein